MKIADLLAPRFRWRTRCHHCDRRIFTTDFERGLAEGVQEWYDTMGGPEERDIYIHTYDCESEPRRLLAPAALTKEEG